MSVAEIAATLTVNVSNGNLVDRINETAQIDQTTARGGLPGFLIVGTTEESISLADLVSPGVVFIKNLDPTNYVQYGIAAYELVGTSLTFFPLGKLKAGEWCWFRLEPTATLYLKANIASCPVVVRVYDD
jgi:hypothetical protein